MLIFLLLPLESVIEYEHFFSCLVYVILSPLLCLAVQSMIHDEESSSIILVQVYVHHALQLLILLLLVEKEEEACFYCHRVVLQRQCSRNTTINTCVCPISY